MKLFVLSTTAMLIMNAAHTGAQGYTNTHMMKPDQATTDAVDFRELVTLDSEDMFLSELSNGIELDDEEDPPELYDFELAMTESNRRCRTNRDCPNRNEFCNQRKRRCQRNNDRVGCSRDRDCSNRNDVCRHNICVRRNSNDRFCRHDSQCRNRNEYCNKNRNRCERASGRRCSQGTDCGNGQGLIVAMDKAVSSQWMCRQGRCKWMCRQGRCQPRSLFEMAM
eukprot:873187_1